MDENRGAPSLCPCFSNPSMRVNTYCRCCGKHYYDGRYSFVWSFHGSVTKILKHKTSYDAILGIGGIEVFSSPSEVAAIAAYRLLTGGYTISWR